LLQGQVSVTSEQDSTDAQLGRPLSGTDQQSPLHAQQADADQHGAASQPLETQQQAAHHQHAAAAHQLSKAAHQQPDAAHQQPDAAHQQPDAAHQLSKAANQQPGTVHQLKKTANQQPGTAHQQPNAAHQQAANQQPVGGSSSQQTATQDTASGMVHEVPNAAGKHVPRAKQYALARLKNINSMRQLTSLSTTGLQQLRWVLHMTVPCSPSTCM